MSDFANELAKHVVKGVIDRTLDWFFNGGHAVLAREFSGLQDILVGTSFLHSAMWAKIGRRVDSSGNVVLAVLFADLEGGLFVYQCNSDSWFSLPESGQLRQVPYPKNEVFSLAALYKKTITDFFPQVGEYKKEWVSPPTMFNKQLSWKTKP